MLLLRPNIDIVQKHIQREVHIMDCRFSAKSTLVILCALLATSVVWATDVEFIPLGDLPGGRVQSRCWGVSPDGQMVAGTGEVEPYETGGLSNVAFRWNESGGMIGLGGLPTRPNSQGLDVSNTGAVVGWAREGNYRTRPFYWSEPTGMLDMGSLNGNPETDGLAFAVSADGEVVVGESYGSNGREAFRWTPTGGMVGLGDLAGGTFSSEAVDISADGSRIVGNGRTGNGLEGFLWTVDDGMVSLGAGAARAISADGQTVVGRTLFEGGASQTDGFRWTEQEGMVSLGVPEPGAIDIYPYGVSGDGSTIVGWWVDVNNHNRPFMWDEEHGIRDAQDALIADYGMADLLDGWTLVDIMDISADGLTLVGEVVGPDGMPQAYVIRLPEPSSAFAAGLFALMFARRYRRLSTSTTKS